MLKADNIKSSFRNFYTYLDGVLDDLTRELRLQSKDLMSKILTERDMNATGKWARTANFKLNYRRKLQRGYEIMNTLSGFKAMQDVRNVGARPFFPNIDAIKKWVIVRGITTDDKVDSVTYAICKTIAKRGLTDSSIKLYNGSSVQYDETVYEKLYKTLFNNTEIINYLDQRIDKYNG